MHFRQAIVFCWFIIVGCLLASTASVSDRIRQWIYKELGIDPKIAMKITAPKAGEGRRHGARVMEVNLLDQSESLVWQCGECWAPAIAGDHSVAVLKKDGIWRIPLGSPPLLAVRSVNLVDILGRTDRNPDEMLVVKSGETTGDSCIDTLQVANILTGTIRSAHDDGPDCVEASNELLHRDEILGAKRLTSTYRVGSYGPALQLLVQEVEPSAVGPLRPLVPQLDARNPTVDRFDPIWRSTTKVVYLSDPE